MDHLHQKVPNIAKAKGRRPPIFGCLAYLLVEPEDVVVRAGVSELQRARTVALFSGAMIGGQSFPALNPTGRTILGQTSNFEFSAFGETLPIDAVAREMSETINGIAEQCSEQFPVVATQLAAETGHSVEDYMAHPAAGLTIVLAFDKAETETASVQNDQQ